METTNLANLIEKYLESIEGATGTRLQDVIDDEVFEVLAGVAWVREALAEFSPMIGTEDQRQVLFGLKSLAA